MDPTAVLLQTRLFGDLQRQDVEALLPSVRHLSFARGQSVWSEGDRALELYVVAKGQLKSFRLSRDGSEVILEVISSGSITGQGGLFHSSGVRQVSVGAMETSQCLTIAREPLLEFMTRHPPAMRQMLESLSELAVRAAHLFSDVAFEDIRCRVARTMLSLAREHGKPSEDGLRIGLKLSQTTLAAMVAASRENVNRALALLLARGAVSQRDGFFFVHDQKALEEELVLP